MTCEEMLMLKNKHDELVYRRLYSRLMLTGWRHYKGGKYYIVNLVWDATQEEWAIQYSAPGRPRPMPTTYVRTLSDWFSKPFAGDPTVIRFREVK